MREGAASPDRQALAFATSCYRFGDDIETWLSGLLEAATPLLDRGAGLHAYAYGIGPAGTVVPRSRVVATAKTPPGLAEIAVPSAMAVPASLAGPLFCRSPAIASSVQRTQELDRSSARVSELFELLQGFGLGDVLGVSAFDPSGIGILLSVPTAAPVAVTTHELQRWQLLRAHMLAGLRLHAQLASEDGDAVLSPSGQMLEARGDARTRNARESLRRQAQHIDRARSSPELDPTAALWAWQGLVEGTWSLVDRFDRDGRRYFVARRNDPRIDAPTLLSERERQVAAYAALGYSNKLIAYTLGLAPSTVSSHLRAAMRRLGCRTLAELAVRYAGGGLDG